MGGRTDKQIKISKQNRQQTTQTGWMDKWVGGSVQI